MNEIHDMMRASSKFHDKIQKFCVPLVKSFGVSHFYHARVTNSGHFIGVNLNRSWEEYFLSDKSHLLIWPDKCQPCKIKNGIRFLQGNENDSLNKLLIKAKEDYSLNFSLQFVEKSNQGTNMYGFALNSSDPLQQMTFANEMPLIRLFIKRFQEEFKTLYSTLDNKMVSMSNLLGPSFYNAKVPSITKSSLRDEFLTRIGIEVPMPLTDRETEIIKYFLKGCPASQIACELFISTRTVEHHLERIKDKFHSSSKSELFQKIRELASIGYFMY